MNEKTRALLERAKNDLHGANLCSINSMSSRQEARRLIDSAIGNIALALAQPQKEDPMALKPFTGSSIGAEIQSSFDHTMKGARIEVGKTRNHVPDAGKLVAQPQQGPGEPTSQWIGCGDCDPAFACHGGAVRCIRASRDDHMQQYDWDVLAACQESLREHMAEIKRLREQSAQPQQEPVAWRTFDGEGGYDYRTYDMNENYRDEWDKSNPNHKGWVEPLYTTPQQPTTCPTCEALARTVMMDQTSHDTAPPRREEQQEPVSVSDAWVAAHGYDKHGVAAWLDKFYTTPPRQSEAIEHYEKALKAAFPKGARGVVFDHWNEARKALEKST